MTQTPISEAKDVTPVPCMQVSVTGKSLYDALVLLAPAISKRSTLPVLQNVLIAASTLGVKLSATNLETHISIRLPMDQVTVQAHGATTTDYAELLAMCNPLKSRMLTLRMQENRLLMESAGVSIPLATIAASEFPLMTAPATPSQELYLDIALLRSLVERVASSASVDDRRPVFTNISLTLHKELLTIAAVDAFRLSVISHQCPGAGSWPVGILIPAKALATFVKKLPKSGEVLIRASSNLIVQFISGGLTASLRLTEGTFPNIAVIIPRDEQIRSTVSVPTAAFIDALTVLAPIAKDSANKVTCSLTETGELHLSAQRDGMDSPLTVKVEHAQGSGAPLTDIMLNYVYLLDSIRGTQYVTLSLQNEKKPVKITSHGVAGWVAVIMPMHTTR